MLSASPLEIQSAHLSFQEYYTALSLCLGRQLPSSVASPWRWTSWWNNVLNLGSEMGDTFGRGLLQAAGADGDSLNLNGKIGGDLPTAMLAVAQLMRAAVAMTLSHNQLGPGDSLLIADGLRLSTSLTELDLSANRICGVYFRSGEFHGEYTPVGLIAITSAIEQSSTLTRLDLSQNSLGVSYVNGMRVPSMEGLLSLAAAVATSTSLLRVGLAYNSIGAGGGKAIGDAFGRNSSLTALDIGGNLIGLKGGKAIADALTANLSLRHVDVRFNSLDAATKTHLRDAAQARAAAELTTRIDM